MLPHHLRWLRAQLDVVGEPNHAVLWCGIVLAWLFLLRASEYLKPDGLPQDPKRGLRPADLVPRLGGKPCGSFALADEVVLTIRGSKTDFMNRGETRNHFAAPRSLMCPLVALRMVEKHFPDRWAGHQRLLPFMRWQSGAPIKRGDVAAWLARCAEAMGERVEEINTHSLRAGGASALWAVFKDTGLVQRWGRWSSPAFHGYLWESRTASQGVAERMAEADLVPL